MAYKPGKQNIVPDALSRVSIPDDPTPLIVATPICLHNTPDDITQFKTQQLSDSYLSAIRTYVLAGLFPTYLTTTQNDHLRSQKDNYFLHDDILY